MSLESRTLSYSKSTLVIIITCLSYYRFDIEYYPIEALAKIEGFNGRDIKIEKYSASTSLQTETWTPSGAYIIVDLSLLTVKRYYTFVPWMVREIDSVFCRFFCGKSR